MVENRGRKSQAELEVVTQSYEVIPRPKPPGDLTPDQASEWRQIVNRLPADWFPSETHAVLAQYCRHAIAARRVAQLIASAEQDPDLDVDQYDKLLKMQERESRALASLGTKMRITQQGTTTHRARKGTMVRKPWED
jgi:hypothetical protein